MFKLSNVTKKNTNQTDWGCSFARKSQTAFVYMDKASLKGYSGTPVENLVFVYILTEF